MLSKISVKKPYTVLVGVILIIVLGILSFRNMSTDLLPDMELPYAIVMTTYPGASPEEVESTVTKPVEQAMAGISNMKQVSSMSNSNVSVVILEFNEGADMNAATIDMRENLDIVSGQWGDTIGNPTIMKINPDMLPIMVAAIDCENMDIFELTEKMDVDILPEIESVEGVASVTTSGELKKNIQVIIQQDKIDEVNEKVQKAITGKFDDATEEMQENQDKLQDGKETLEKTQEDAATQMANGALEIDKNEKSIEEGLRTINQNLATLEENEKKLEESLTQVNAGIAQMAATKAELKATISSLEEAEEMLSQTQTMLITLRTQKENIETLIEQNGETIELRTQLNSINGQINMILGKLSEQGITEEQLPTKLLEVQTALKQSRAGLEELEKQEKTVKKSKKEIVSGQKKLKKGKKTLLKTKEQLEAGKIGLEEAKKEINKQSMLAAIKFSVATVELNTGQSKLDEAETTLENAKEDAKKGADINNIITKTMVENILTAENFEMPAGYITDGESTYLVKVGEEIESGEALEKLVICDMDLEDLEPICLSDVADIVVMDNSQEQYTVVNGNPAISVTIEKATGFSTGDVTDRLLERFDELEENIDGLHFSVLMDQGVYIDMVVDSVIENLLLGGLFATIILLLFLKDFRPTLVVACSIPLSVIAAVVCMYFSGVSLNVISLSGLALGVGMLVDNSVVVIENIYRMRNEEGAGIKRAAVEGATQVAGAILASTLTTVCVFAPIIFTEGITKQIFVDLALTLGYSLLASLVVSLTLVPAMAQGVLRKDKVHKEGFIVRVQNMYAVLLEKLLAKKALVLLTSLGLLILFVVLAFTRGTAFMPEMQSTQMTAVVSPPEDVDKMEPEALYECADQVMEKFLEVEGIETVGALSGGGGMMSMMSGGSGDGISMYILLNEENTRSNKEIQKEMLEKTKDLNCVVSVEASAMDMTSLMGSGITLQVKGKDLDKLQKITEEMIAMVEDVEGIASISNGMEESEQELRITVDKEKAMKYSLTVAQVFQQVYAKLADAKQSTIISTDTEELGVYVSHDKDSNITRKDLERLKIDYTDMTTQKAKKVKLSKIATFALAASPNSINRVDQTRYMSISIALEPDYNIGLMSDKIMEIWQDYEMPSGYVTESTGEDEMINESMEQLGLLMVVGILFMYLIMVAQFQSLLSPFIILFTIPLAFTGGFMGLYFSGSEVSIIAMIGFVMLSGIIVNNGIVLVDYINQLRASGVPKYDAIVQAGRTRLRPILMTALTTILGLIPMLVTKDPGADMMKPMSIVTVGGMVYGTLLTLFVVPCIYAILNRKSDESFMDYELEELTDLD